MQCTTHQWNGYQYRHSCYNDIFALYFFRDLGVDEASGKHPKHFPYLDSTRSSRVAEKDIEYPVGTGLYMGTVASTTKTARGYFNASAVGLALAGLVGVFATTLVARDRTRVLYLALAPTLFLYAFHNWDLLAVGVTALAYLAFVRRRDGTAGVLLGVGGSTKLYPAFLLPVFVIARWRSGDRSGAKRMVVGSAIAALVMNLPVFIANSQGWWYPWKFQSRRFSNFETLWYMIYRHAGRFASQHFWFDPGGFPKIVNYVTAVLFIGTAALLVRAELKRDRFRTANVVLGVLLLWLITAKVFSPQYMLWLLPFFVLVAIPWYGYVAFVVTDAAVWAAISWYFLAYAVDPSRTTLQMNVLEGTVFARYVVLGWILWMSRRVPEAVADAEVVVAELPEPAVI